MNEVIVDIEQVVKTYRKGREKVEVLHGLDLQIRRGEFCALMGPSGSGKTTLLNLIGGLDQPSSGRIRVNDQQIERLGSRDLARWRAGHVGFIFQFYNLMPMLSAQRNVELPLLLKKMSGKERRERALTALEIVGLSDRARHLPRELSGGQEQRVAIARAIVSDPDLLLADEPTGDLDRATADDILDLLHTLNERHGKTILMVTHDPAAAERAGRIVQMDKGTLAEAA
ncbi:ABC transporter ATP-binding protein [Wenzhouxiangella sp. XN79A]|uniref:ABC transporter ATP-binding protein n=1 Tax=Wenzhouxiangella sp. XN79A TaxID=2724193 RepID=UPI00144AB1D7|nr:ABC transporter ATP-binding protein [Wenzhouxiangella sp. XN79A]NKI36209.1 ABC transporter ATP-binding protein [Wenzhouxiangella sp. XN79A]